jgi:hypothetical protein
MFYPLISTDPVISPILSGVRVINLIKSGKVHDTGIIEVIIIGKNKLFLGLCQWKMHICLLATFTQKRYNIQP